MTGIKRMFAAAKKADTLELMIYDAIGSSGWEDGVMAKDVKAALDANPSATKIVMRINSPGGDVFEGSAIYSLLSQDARQVECYVDGLAASAAFTIAMAADTLHISESAMMMCHNAWGLAIGSAQDMRRTADLLEKASGVMCEIYAKRSGMDPAAMQKLMDEETWMTAKEAVAMKFAEDVIGVAGKDALALVASFDLSKFAKTPERFRAELPAVAAAVTAGGCSCPCADCAGGDCAGCDCTGCSSGGCGAADCECEDGGMKVKQAARRRALEIAAL